MTKLSDQITAAVSATNSGIYRWDVRSNRLYGDAQIAALFQLPPELTERGLPLETYLERVHPDERQRTATAIQATVNSNIPFQEYNRKVRRNGTVLNVLAMGRCFHAADGSPREFAGVIYEMTEQDWGTAQATISDLCLAAYRIAEHERESEAIRLLSSVLLCLRAHELPPEDDVKTLN